MSLDVIPMAALGAAATAADSTPPAAASGWRMPAETAAQDRVWMAFPPSGAPLSETETDAREAQAAWAAVAHAILDFEPVRMLVDPADMATARRMLSQEIEVCAAPLDDAWMRDIGPTFVLGAGGELGAVDWVFNGWGAQHWARWGKDAQIAPTVTALAGAEPVCSAIVNEGGGMVSDGLGTVFLTDTVQLDPHRNPDLDRAAIETELARTIGATNVIWLPRGLTRDSQDFGTRGHADMLVAIPAPGRLLLHTQTDPRHPDHGITRELRAFLSDTRDGSGARWDIVELPAPRSLRDAHGWVDLNYINHLVINDAVIACRFDDPADDAAMELLAGAYPGREVVALDARPIFARGGGIHCITQHQPSASPAAPHNPKGR